MKSRPARHSCSSSQKVGGLVCVRGHADMVQHFATCATPAAGQQQQHRSERRTGKRRRDAVRRDWKQIIFLLLRLFDVCETYFVFCWFCGGRCTCTLAHELARGRETSKEASVQTGLASRHKFSFPRRIGSLYEAAAHQIITWLRWIHENLTRFSTQTWAKPLKCSTACSLCTLTAIVDDLKFIFDLWDSS